MALELVLTWRQNWAVGAIQEIGECYWSVCEEWEWQELVSAGYCWRDGYVYRDHETYATPDFELCEPDALGRTTLAADQLFEDTQAARFEDGSLQI